ncbi:Pik1 [Kluyveromyces lactis]|nr:Pik1 [Kluyveromyces lactis]
MESADDRNPDILLKYINSSNFTLYNNIEYLTRYADNIGIHFYLCEKLLGFPHKELQFYIPQLVQILLTIETESLALEEILLRLSSENPHFALITFWQLQALLGDLAHDPTSYSFQVARRVLNHLQFILFNTTRKNDNEKINENIAPALILCSMVTTGFAFPGLLEHTKPLIKSQGRRQKSYVFKLAKHAMKNLTKNLTLKNTLANSSSGRKVSSDSVTNTANVDLVDTVTTKEDFTYKKKRQDSISDLSFDMVDDIGEKLFEDHISNSIKLPKRRDTSYIHAVYKNPPITEEEYTNSMPDLRARSSSSASMPDLSAKKSMDAIRETTTNPSYNESKRQMIDITHLSTTKKIKLLKVNYFHCCTQFAIALESISQRLAQVPPEARLSALRAELSILNRDLPAEVDIPELLPANKKGKLHKLIKISANEAQVLNSAEKVPYLLFIEFLKDDFDFDPTSEQNIKLLEKNPRSSYIFDLSYVKQNNAPFKTNMPIEISSGSANQEMDLADVSMVKLTNQSEAESYRHELMMKNAKTVPVIPPDSHTRGSELDFVADLQEATERLTDIKLHRDSSDDLATQMRVSAMMLAQLDQSPQQLSDSANQIRAKIIASMQEMQDKFGYRDLEAIHGMAGERKLENDFKTGGLTTSNDKTSTSYLGEDWNTKKEKIRKSSEFGHLPNWDLCSVISKSGDDLRQEAFACQLIQAMAAIWSKENVGVWVKKMNILITSSHTGLVETITNAISVHSIKKSLTTHMIEEGSLDEKGDIASLLDHFSRVYGDPNGFKFRHAQDNFASSLAAYSIICYLLRIKDRHNGNIMIDNEGHVVHIDFGFMLSNSPGSVGFEAAPFKLTYEYVEVMGGSESETFKKFVELCKAAFKALRKYADHIVSLCEIMQKDSLQPCFQAGDQTSVQLRQRFHLELSDEECDEFVENVLIGKSLGSRYTRLYDHFQLLTQGIYS